MYIKNIHIYSKKIKKNFKYKPVVQNYHNIIKYK
jgi:hypothetical protein